jgi:hypothetical protein
MLGTHCCLSHQQGVEGLGGPSIYSFVAQQGPSDILLNLAHSIVQDEIISLQFDNQEDVLLVELVGILFDAFDDDLVNLLSVFLYVEIAGLANNVPAA